jgi:hypothetical protein
MKKVQLLLSALILLLGSQIAIAQAPTENALLWKISGNGLESPSYLFGTIHIICSDNFVLPESLKAAIKTSEKLVLEIDMSDPQLPIKMQQLAINDNFANVKAELNEEDAKMLDDFLKANYGQGIEQLGIFKPFMLNSLVMLKTLECDYKQYETELVNLSKADSIMVEGLETAEFQIGIFDEMPREKQLSSLIEQIKNPEKTKKELEELIEAYIAKDMVKIAKLILENEEFEGFADQFIYSRNETWIPKMEEYINKESVFFAVGAGHLPSEKGVIALLRDRGYTVEAVD